MVASPDFATEIIGGRTWLVDTRATNNAVDEDEAQVVVDADGSIELLWRQETDGNGSYDYAHFDRTGQPLQNATFITANVSAYGPVGGPRGSAAGIDSNGHIHVVFEDGPYNITYEQFNASGDLRVGPKQVGPTDSQVSRRPAIAMGLDDTVHIAHGEYKFQCEDVAYDKLANDGSDIWIDRVVSSDVAARTDNGLIRADRYNGNFYFTFGSDTGSWLGRFDKFGVKTMASVKFRNDTDAKTAEVAGAPNGSMLVVWEDAGRLLYTMVNATGARIVNAFALESNGTVGPFPRVAVASDGSAMIVWEDNRTGTAQVMYGAIPSDGNLSDWTPVQLTHSTGEAFDPAIAFDPDDQPVIAWTDTRDGNREIYFKRALGCGMELYAPPLDLSGGHFLHPNETYVMPLALKNKGMLADSFTIDLTYTPGAVALGWGVSLNETYIDNLGPGEAANLSLSIHAPANATTGDNISVSVNASSVTWPDCFDRIDLSAFVRVTRGLSLSSNVTYQEADNGQTVSFEMRATNTGDVREGEVNVTVGAALAPNGYNVTSDKAALSMDPNQSENFTVRVTVPTDTALSPANLLAHIGVIIQSSADATVYTAREILVRTKPMFIIELTPDAPLREARSGTATGFNVTVRNVGNLAAQAQIDLDLQGAAMNGWSATLDAATLYLAGGQQSDVQVSVSVPANATAGATYTFVFSARSVKLNVSAEINLSVVLPPLCRATAGLSSAQGPSALAPAVGIFEVSNTGDRALSYTISFVRLPPSWPVSASVGGAPATSVGVQPLTPGRVRVEALAPPDALAGPFTLTVRFTSIDCGAYEVEMPFTLPPTRSLVFLGDLLNGTAPPGGTAEYALVVRNDGNAPSPVNLSAAALPSGFAARWVDAGPDGLGAAPLDTSTPITVAAFSRLVLRVYLEVPAVTSDRAFDFTALAGTDDGILRALTLHFVLGMPDLVIENLTLDPADPVAGEPTNVSLRITNRGSAPARGSEVQLLVNGSVVATRAVGALDPNASVEVTFVWIPAAGAHTVGVAVSMGGSTQESKTGNNEASRATTVSAAPPEPVPPAPRSPTAPPSTLSPALAAGALLGAAGVAGALAFMVLRRRRGPPGNP